MVGFPRPPPEVNPPQRFRPQGLAATTDGGLASTGTRTGRRAMWTFLALIIAAPLVFLAWPATAQAPQPGWIADPGTGCRVWSKNPQQETIAWSGSCGGGLAQGG